MTCCLAQNAEAHESGKTVSPACPGDLFKDFCARTAISVFSLTEKSVSPSALSTARAKRSEHAREHSTSDKVDKVGVATPIQVKLETPEKSAEKSPNTYLPQIISREIMGPSRQDQTVQCDHKATIQEISEMLRPQLPASFSEEVLVNRIKHLGFTREEAERRVVVLDHVGILSKDRDGSWCWTQMREAEHG